MIELARGVEPWTCHAHPASQGGRPCGHHNASGGIVYDRTLCCERCGATKHASDSRLARKQEKSREHR